MPHTQMPDEWPGYAKELGLSIQRKRNEKGLSQERVAYNANLSRFSYQQLEKGESRPGRPSNPSLLNVMAVAQVLGVTLDQLLPKPWPDLRAK
ncbi:XRE family transcriptional regulator [Bifidobacterium sp. DSM 109958]|uniref:XRE family transcriptional regulator n=1 Tax=Bifidobacterium moraviense TaxID=2675323 RepID=A0A7Y0F1F7_9BIFI|nr:helix-turn-helix transcriptional regulator [Bifidobacterium sp. DSM 109958]NMN00124.1 XRE family transcriptional regulator [Bifidobacterium sp. DSM 109958]